MNKVFILYIVLFILISVIIKTIKEGFESNQKNDMDDIIKYIQKSIDSREGARVSNNIVSDDKYKKQILGLKNAITYATYIKNKII